MVKYLNPFIIKKSIFIFALLITCLSLVAQVNLDSGLVGCYPFSGNANDQSGHGNNGVVHGATLTTDRFGNPSSAYSFSISAQTYIDIPNFPAMDPTDELSISIWTQSTGYTSTCPIVLIKDSAQDRICACAEYTGGPYCIWDYGDFLVGGRMILTPGAYTGAWQHYVFLISQSKNIKEIFLDGVMIDSSGCTGTVNKAGRTLSIGGSQDWTNKSLWWQGSLDDVRIYNRALTPAEVMILYKSPPPCMAVPVCTVTSKFSSCTNCNGSAHAILSDSSAGYTFRWSNGDTGSTVSNLCPGMYYVYVFQGGTLVTTDSTTIGTTGGPTVIVNASPATINKGGSTILTATASGGTGPYTYIWNGTDTGQVVNASPLVNTTYTVTVTDSNGCVAIAVITIDVECGQLFVPDAFSPNGDGQNDILYVRGDCIKTMDFIIYDRWGNQVFESTDPSDGWDGKYRGQHMNTGIYAYYLSATDYDGNTYTKKGNVSLVR